MTRNQLHLLDRLLKTITMRTNILAFVATFGFIALLWLYVREFTVFYNTLGVLPLAIGSIIGALALAGAVLYRFRERFTPLNRHGTEIALILVLSAFFAPLFGSWLNRGLGRQGERSFEFVSETAYIASGYGILKGEKLKPTGYFLDVKDGDKRYRFKYKQQAYYPLTRPGERILLPVKKGLLGLSVVTLR